VLQEDQKKMDYTEGSLENVRDERANLVRQAEVLQREYNSLSDRLAISLVIDSIYFSCNSIRVFHHRPISILILSENSANFHYRSLVLSLWYGCFHSLLNLPSGFQVYSLTTWTQSRTLTGGKWGVLWLNLFRSRTFLPQQPLKLWLAAGYAFTLFIVLLYL